MTSLLQPTESEARSSTRTYRDSARPLWRRWLLSRGAAVYVVLLLVILYADANVPFFDRQITMTFLLLDIAPILLIALPMTLIIVTGEIDLSVASTVALSSVLFGMLYDKGAPIVVAAIAALVLSASPAPSMAS